MGKTNEDETRRGREKEDRSVFLLPSCKEWVKDEPPRWKYRGKRKCPSSFYLMLAFLRSPFLLLQQQKKTIKVETVGFSFDRNRFWVNEWEKEKTTDAFWLATTLGGSNGWWINTTKNDGAAHRKKGKKSAVDPQSSFFSVVVFSSSFACLMFVSFVCHFLPFSYKKSPRKKLNEILYFYPSPHPSTHIIFIFKGPPHL